MRSAPSVIYPVGPCAPYGRALVALGLGVLLSLLSWGWSASAYASESFWWVVLLALVWAVGVALAWTGTAAGELHWDALATPSDGSLRSGAWSWCAEGHEASRVLSKVEAVLDWQGGMLLRLTEPSGGQHWAWAQRVDQPPRWREFRRALTSASPV